MLGLLFGAILIFGVILLLLKLVLGLIVLPFKIGFGLIKIAVGILIVIPLLIFLCTAGAALLPLLVLGVLAAVVIAPVVLIAKAIF